MYGPTWPFLFTYGSHDMRHTGFRRLTMINGTPGDWGVTKTIVFKKVLSHMENDKSLLVYILKPNYELVYLRKREPLRAQEMGRKPNFNANRWIVCLFPSEFCYLL